MPRRRAKRSDYGQGTVFFDKQTGRYIAQIYNGQGRSIRRRAATAEAAETLRQELIKQRDSGVDMRGANMALQDFANLWFNEVIKARNLKPMTVRYNRQMIEYYILPALGKMPLIEIKPLHITRFINELKKDVSPQTTQHAYKVLRRIFDAAVNWEYITRNPARKIDEPPRVKRAEARAMTPGEVHALLQQVAGDRLETLYHVALTLGLRQGELLGLRWSDIDFTRATLKVTQQVQTIDGKSQTITPKSESSKRELPLPPRLVERLRAQWKRLQDERHNPKWHEHGFVFPSNVGTPIVPRNLIRHFYTARDRAGLPKEINFHLMRHTVASRLDSITSERVKQAILGHAPQTVTGRYTHAELSEMRIAIEKLEQTLQSMAA